MSDDNKGIILNERDHIILKEVARFKFCLGRQIRRLAEFSGERACDRRLKKLVDFEYLERQHILYGIPRLYFLGKYAKKLKLVNYYSTDINVIEIRHDIAVVDTVIFLIETLGISLQDISSERQLHSMDGFGDRKHRPDFIFNQGDKKWEC